MTPHPRRAATRPPSKWTALALGLSLAWTAAAQAAVDPKVKKLDELAKAGKPVALAAVDGWNHVTAWAKVAIKGFQIAKNGKGFTGTATIMGKDTKVCMYRTSEDFDGWAFVFQPSAFHFGQLGPAFAASPLSHIRLSRQVFTFATHGAELENKDVPAEAKAFYQEILGAGFDLELKPGVNMHSRIDGDHSGKLAPVFARIGIDDPDTVFQGSLGSAIGEYLLETEVNSFDTGDMKSAAIQLDLKATYPELEPGFFPKWLKAGQMALFFHGELGAMEYGFQTLLRTRIEEQDLDFLTTLKFALEAAEVEDGEAPSGPDMTVSLMGQLVSPWEEVGGVKWLTLDEATLKGTVGTTTSVVLHGKTHIAEREVALTAGLAASDDIGALPLPVLRGQVEYLDLEDLILLTNEIGEALEVEGRIGQGDLPHIRIEKVDLGFVPPGAEDEDTDTGDEGIHIAGTLVVEGERWSHVDGLAGPDGLSLNGEMKEFKIGELTLEKAHILMDAQFPSIKDPHMPALGVEGGFDLLGSRQHAKVFVTVGGYELELDSKVWELWDAHLRLYASAFDNPDFLVHGVLENHFAEKLSNLGGANARKLAEQAANAVDEAGKKISDALHSVKNKEEEMKKARAKIDEARRKANKAISDAQKDVDRWYGGYKACKRGCSKRCSKRVKVCVNYVFGKKCWKKTVRWDCPDVVKCGKAGYYWTGYKTAKGVLAGVKAANNEVLKGTSAATHPTVEALSHAANVLGDAVDAARSQKQHLETTLRSTLEVAAFIGKGLGKVLDIEHAEFEMSLKELIQGKPGHMAIEGRFAGKGFSASLTWDGKDIADLAKRLVDRLIAGHGKSSGHKSGGSGTPSKGGTGTIAAAWTKLGGGTRDVGYDPKGGLWALAPDGTVWKWEGKKFVKKPGGLTRIAVGPSGPVGVNKNEDIFRWNGKSWSKMPGKAVEVGVGANGDVWVINKAGGIFHWMKPPKRIKVITKKIMMPTPFHPGRRRGKIWRQKVAVPAGKPSWVRVAGAAVRVAVDGKGRAWVVNKAGKIYRRKGQGWELLPGRAKDVGAGADGTVWVVGTAPAGKNGSGRLYRWNEASRSWNASKGFGSAIAGDARGRAYTVGGDWAVWHGPR